mgnify:CR=1 FL=1
MSQVEKQILENLFDALDRLFDHECKVIDLYSLVYASEIALGQSSPIISLGGCASELEVLVRSGKPEEQQRDEALLKTNSLRGTLNELLPI